MSNQLSGVIHEEGYVDVNYNGLEKRISLEDYAALVIKVKGDDEVSSNAEMFRMPTTLHSFSNSSEGLRVNMYFPERRATLSHENGETYDVPLPNIMIAVHLKDVSNRPGHRFISSIKWMQTEKSQQDVDVVWSGYPNQSEGFPALSLPNMYSDGNMCTGENTLPSVIYTDLSILEMLYHDVLIRSEFNNDLTVPNIDSDSYSSARRWLERLDGATSFPYDEC